MTIHVDIYWWTLPVVLVLLAVLLAVVWPNKHYVFMPGWGAEEMWGLFKALTIICLLVLALGIVIGKFIF